MPRTSGDELAIGAPWREVSGNFLAGAVVLVSDVDDQAFDSHWHQDSTDVPGVAEAGDLFGQELAAGDFNGDGIDDLVAVTFGYLFLKSGVGLFDGCGRLGDRKICLTELWSRQRPVRSIVPVRRFLTRFAGFVR